MSLQFYYRVNLVEYFYFFFSYYLNIFYWLKESEPSYLKAIVRFYPITSPLPDRKKKRKSNCQNKLEEMYKDTCTGKHCIDMCAWNVTRIKSLYCFNSKTEALKSFLFKWFNLKITRPLVTNILFTGSNNKVLNWVLLTLPFFHK